MIGGVPILVYDREYSVVDEIERPRMETFWKSALESAKELAESVSQKGKVCMCAKLYTERLECILMLICVGICGVNC